MEAADCRDKHHVAVSNEKLLTYSKDLGFRSTDRSVHDCAVLAQWTAGTALSLCHPPWFKWLRFSFEECEASEWLGFSILAFCQGPDVTRQAEVYQCTGRVSVLLISHVRTPCCSESIHISLFFSFSLSLFHPLTAFHMYTQILHFACTFIPTFGTSCSCLSRGLLEGRLF